MTQGAVIAALVSLGGALAIVTYYRGFKLGLWQGQRSKHVLRPVLTGRHQWVTTSEGLSVALDGGVIVAFCVPQAVSSSDVFDQWRAYVRVPAVGNVDGGSLQWSSDLDSLSAARERADEMLAQQFAHLIRTKQADQ